MDLAQFSQLGLDITKWVGGTGVVSMTATRVESSSTSPSSTSSPETRKRKNETSELPAFYKRTREDRVRIIAEMAGLRNDEIAMLNAPSPLSLDTADKMIENALGVFPLPLGIATYFRINGVDRLVPMVTEEPSVVAAASYAAKLARPAGGFTASGSEPLMIAQIQLVGKEHWTSAREKVLENKAQLLSLANAICPSLKQNGGGAQDVEARIINTVRGDMLIVHLIVDVRDSMGANTVTKMAEGIAPLLESITESTARLRILSNLAVHRVFKAEAIWTRSQLEEAVKGTGKSVDEIIDGILDAWAFADADPFRATTHNKGIMNGVDAVVIATGNDFRAVESGAHAFASYRNGRYGSLTSYERTPEGNLRGMIEIPLALGTVGGATRTNPISRLCYKILGLSRESVSLASPPPHGVSSANSPSKKHARTVSCSTAAHVKTNPVPLLTTPGITSLPTATSCDSLVTLEAISPSSSSSSSTTTSTPVTVPFCSSSDLGEIIAAVGLASNFAALRALTTEGILRGHMKLHAKNIAIAGGAQGPMIDFVAAVMASEGNVSASRARELLTQHCHVM